jgi:pyruvate ferredoxin oxidoreductase alpha subunit
MKNANKFSYAALTGGFAVGQAMKQIQPDVVAMYPITPQTPIMEYFAKKVADGEVDTELITVESEHSAMSACIGASAAGARVMTASSSQGIMYMFETLPIASAMRLPIVMAVANRAISGPLNIHGDHSDAMIMRETGWVQIFSETVQEAYDNMIMACRLAEKALLPVTVNMDGFFTSHSVENIRLLQDETVRKFVGNYQPKQALLDFERPVTYGSLVLPNAFFDFRVQVYEAMERVRDVYVDIASAFNTISGEEYDVVEAYRTKDATHVIVAIGSVCGTIKDAVDALREKGQRVGLLKIRLFRPFPYAAVKKVLENVEKISVMDRNLACGTQQALAAEISQSVGRIVDSYVYGLGGREVYEKQIIAIFEGRQKGMFVA